MTLASLRFLGMTDQMPSRHCETVAELRVAHKEMEQYDTSAIGVDIETNGLSPYAPGAQIVLVQVSTADGFVVMADARRIPHDKLFAWLDLWFRKQDCIKIFHNGPFDISWLLFFGARHGLTMPAPLHDTMIAERLLTAGTMADCSLAAVTERYLGYALDKTQQKSFLDLGDDDFDPEQLEYGAKDVTCLTPIMDRQFRLIEKRGLSRVYQLEMAVLPIAIEAGLHGVEIDIDRWRVHIQHLTEDMATLQKELETRLQPYLNTARKKNGQNLGYHYYDHNEWLLAVSEWEADKQAVYDRIVTRAQGKIALWRAEYTELQQQSRKAAAEWKKQNPEPTEQRGYAREMQRRWEMEHPKPVFCATTINLGASVQKAQALLALGVPLPKTEKGQYSTKRTVLQKYEGEFPLVGEIIRWTGYAKLIQSFGESVLEKADSRHRLHPQFNTMGADTGRFSCKGPNVQQIPANKLGQEFRHCFIAGLGKVFVCCDYSQIELRVLCEFSGEPGMLWAFDNDVDLHSLTALKMFPHIQEAMHLSPASIDAMMAQGATNVCILEQLKHILAQVKEQFDFERKRAKTISFGIPYGQTKFGFSDQWMVTPDEAQEIIDAYYEANQRIKAWLVQNANTCMNRWYAVTPLGRKRFFEPLTSDLPYRVRKRKENGYRRAMNNHPIQAASADITKIAIVRIEKALRAAGLLARQVMFIHDEIVVECPEAEAALVQEIVTTEMKAAARVVLHRCPVDVSCKVGTTWEH